MDNYYNRIIIVKKFEAKNESEKDISRIVAEIIDTAVLQKEGLFIRNIVNIEDTEEEELKELRWKLSYDERNIVTMANEFIKKYGFKKSPEENNYSRKVFIENNPNNPAYTRGIWEELMTDL